MYGAAKAGPARIAADAARAQVGYTTLTRSAIDMAAAAFKRALAVDPSYTLARAGLAMASAEMYLRYAPEGEVQTWGVEATREALAAIALDPDLAEAHLARAAVSR